MSNDVMTQILQELEAINEKMATKEELVEIRNTMATKEELVGIRNTMATKEELVEIRNTMATKEELAGIRNTMATKEELDGIRNTMVTKEEWLEVKSEMNHRFDTLETITAYMQQDIAEIKNNIQHIEKNQPQDIMGMLKQINSQLAKTVTDDEFSLINEKVEELESDVKLIKKAITN